MNQKNNFVKTVSKPFSFVQPVLIATLILWCANVYGQATVYSDGATWPATKGVRSNSNSPATGQILLDQQPNAVSGDFSNANQNQVIAENFILTTTETIGKIVIWGGYWPNNIPLTTDDWTVIFHNDAAGLPGTVISTELGVPSTRVVTGIILFGRVDEYEFCLDLVNPVTLGPGGFWVEIFNNYVSDTETVFWETGNPDVVGNGQPGHAYAPQAPGASWGNLVGDLAIQLVTEELQLGTIIIKKITDPASTGVDFSFQSPFLVTVKTPIGITGSYIAGYGTFGPVPDATGITGTLELVDDIIDNTTDGCQSFVGFTPGNIAVIDRGQCSFTTKVLNAQAAGAIAVIVVNSYPLGHFYGGIINMNGEPTGITIPSLFISKEDGDIIKAKLPGVNATLQSSPLTGVFSIQHNQMQTFSDVPAGTYTVIEDDPLLSTPFGYVLTNIAFNDPDVGSSGDLGTRTATIDLDPGETVEATFTNEPCTLEPPTDTKQLNQQHSVKFSLGYALPDFSVIFTVVSGPNAGETASTVTDINGEAEFTYIGDGGPGTDIIEANVAGFFSCTAEVTWVFPFMTMWAVNDHTDGKLQYYTLDMGSAFLNIEGEIKLVEANGDLINDAKDLEDLIIDSSPLNENHMPNEVTNYLDATFYIVNNVGTSTIYKLNYGEFDGNPATHVNATLVGSTGLPADPGGSSPNEISSLLVFNSKLYGLGKRSKKLYEISTVDGSLTQVFTLNVAGDFRTDGMTFRQGGMTLGPTSGTVYLLKTNDSGGESEIWKFNSFPSGNIEYVRQIETSGKVEALTAHPDGYLYASDQETLYKISVDNSDIWYLADYTVDIEGMDYFYELEENMSTVPTRAFIPIAPTPVELVSFTAEVMEDKVVLNWETATEVNNYGFNILRRAQNDEWVTLAFVDGHGNSNSPKSYRFADSNPLGGSKFSYRLKQIDNDGSYEYSDIVEVEFVPTEFALYQNYPNPFNPATKIKYSIPKESNVTIRVFDILGNEIRTLVTEKQDAGTYEIEFEGSNMVSGIYIYQMRAGDFSNTKKMLLMK